MPTALARQEMRRFLTNSDPEVLSISGRWGVGKTFGWHEALEDARKTRAIPMARYAYVSAFGVKSIDSLQAAIFQATVKLNSSSIEPTIESFQENLSSISGWTNFAEQGGRRGFGVWRKLVSLVPYGEKAAELLLPGAALLIKKQIICIDDIERTGDGLSVSDILGFVSMLRHEKGCKVILLLNEDGLGDDKANFRKYLEKVVDQAIQYIPTPAESAAAALDLSQDLDAALARNTEHLGITNIRVIKRIRRFLGFLAPELTKFHDSITTQAIATATLFGWCTFEPALAPDLAYVKRYSVYTRMLEKKEPSEQEAQWNAQLSGFGFGHADDFDLAILSGLETGGFDMDAIKFAAEKLHNEFVRADVREGIQKPWMILRDTFENNEADFKAALIESVIKFSKNMSPREFNDVFITLKELDAAEKANYLLLVYMSAQGGRSRDFFNINKHSIDRPIAPEIAAAFEAHLDCMPLARDPKDILVKIDRESGWNPDDEEFLSSISENDYYFLLKAARGDDLRSIIRAGLRFNQFQDDEPNRKEIGRKIKAALRRLGEDSPLNAMRVRSYVGVGRDEPAQPKREA